MTQVDKQQNAIHVVNKSMGSECPINSESDQNRSMEYLGSISVYSDHLGL